MLAPRRPASAPAVIVAIDEASLRRYGQWPWPRTLLARLLAKIGEASPAAIGLDVLMPEPDRLSPDRLAGLIAGVDRETADRLARLPSSDAVLAAALRDLPIVLAVAGLDVRETPAGSAALREPTLRRFGEDPALFVRRYPALLRSVDVLHEAARGHGLVSADPEGGVVRRLPLIALVERTLVPGFGLEMLRVASGATISVRANDGGVESAGVGDVLAPTAPDGSAWLHFSPHDPGRFVGAADVLAGAVDAGRFERKLVLVGITAIGLSDHQATPVGDRMPGVEIHAQLLEGLFDGALLARPRWTPWLEAGLLVMVGLAFIGLVPAWPVRLSVALMLATGAAMLALGFALFRLGGILLDPLGPALGIVALFTVLLVVTLSEAESQRVALRRLLERQREAAARIAGELEAARRIQMGSLPSPAGALPGETRVTIYSFLEPAQEVGGDLYDFYRLDADRLVFLIGDVSGKGLPGSLFMAVSKSLYKSTALRRGGEIATMMREANADISRDNAEMLFVTIWAGVLDVRTGALAYCNAGHDDPWRLPRPGRSLDRLEGGGGPPLCAVDDFPYMSAMHQMEPGETLCLVTDGVTEARNRQGALYGRHRLEEVLAGLDPGADPTAVGEAIRGSVAGFVEGMAPVDDIAILVLRWNGPDGATRAMADRVSGR
jgi:serine phosphatase RsbU (regulator of sigma subunit)/CHASE2 domain-containing sensor protein